MWRALAEEDVRCAECNHSIAKGFGCLSTAPGDMPQNLRRADFQNFCVDCVACGIADKPPCFVLWLDRARTKIAAKELCGYCVRSIPKHSDAFTQKFYCQPIETDDALHGGVGTGLFSGRILYRLVDIANQDMPLNEYRIYFCERRDCKTRFAREMIGSARRRGFRQSSPPNASRVGDALTAPFVANTLETNTQIPKYHAKGGHGFAAEDANNLADRLRGRNAKVVGQSNELNGADRIVNGVKVQSKYYATASKTVRAAFDPATGNYRYSGQVLEVPKDQYEDCLRHMRERIRNGKVPGVSNPAEAENLVKQGTVTYKQARNIARAGNIDSLIFDLKTQSVTFGGAFAVSFIIDYAQGKRSGMSDVEAIKSALHSALAAGGSTLITSVISAQILRTRYAAIGAVTMRAGVRAAYRTTLGREAIHRIAAGSLGRGVYGAAAVNHVSRLLRSNIITGGIAVAVTSAPDFYRAAFARSISWRQFMKNAAVNVAGVAGGVGGWMGGAAAGAAIGSVVPGPGTVVGGIVGGMLGALGGGFAASRATRAVADGVIEDDSKKLLEALETELQTLAFEYMLSEEEINKRVVPTVKDTVDQRWLRNMYKETRNGASSTRRRFVRREFEPEFQAIARRRPRVVMPSAEKLDRGIANLADELGKAIEDDLDSDPSMGPNGPRQWVRAT